MPLLDVIHVKKMYTTLLGGQKVEALTDASFSVEAGEFAAIMGESGSGKTTLLNILAALDKPTQGQVLLEGQDLSAIPDKEISAFRRDHLGFVFQDFNLLDTFSVRDNILLPLVLAGQRPKDMEPQLTAVSQALHIGDILDKFPYEISGGQKQRAAVARAIITAPQLLLADEPTGALDSKSSQNLLKTFAAIHGQGQTILMVTHSAQAASYARRVLFIRDGWVYHQMYRGDMDQDAFYQKIISALTVLSAGGELNA